MSKVWLVTGSASGLGRNIAAGQAESARAADAERWREISVSKDVNAPGSLPALGF